MQLQHTLNSRGFVADLKNALESSLGPMLALSTPPLPSGLSITPHSTGSVRLTLSHEIALNVTFLRSNVSECRGLLLEVLLLITYCFLGAVFYSRDEIVEGLTRAIKRALLTCNFTLFSKRVALSAGSSEIRCPEFLSLMETISISSAYTMSVCIEIIGLRGSCHLYSIVCPTRFTQSKKHSKRRGLQDVSVMWVYKACAHFYSRWRLPQCHVWSYS